MEELDKQSQYQKYRKCVKLWETDFKTKNGRIPSKVKRKLATSV